MYQIFIAMQRQNRLKNSGSEMRVSLEETEVREMENNNFWTKLKNSLGDRAVSVVTVVVFILLLVGVVIAYQNGIGLL